jgi:pimeloyl-ACP methyl ester carboxylesterase
MASGRSSPHHPERYPELGPLVSGTSSYVRGTFVWTDYAYDDRGANTIETSIVGPRGAAPGTAARSGGDAVYADWAQPGNTADLIQLQISEEGGELEIRAILESLVDPTLPILGVAFDTDANPATGAASLPGGRWPALDPLGIDLLVIVSEEGAEVRRYDGAEWRDAGRFDAEVDAEVNTLDTRIRTGLLPRSGGVWRAFAVVGVVNPSTGGSWVDGTEPIFDLAFVGGEPQVKWQDLKQSDILAGLLTTDTAAARLDFEKLRRRRTELVDESTPGFKTFLYHSALDLPEGVTLPAPQVSLGQHEYLGPYQPYQVFVPEVMTEGNPLLVSLHGSNNNHMVSIFTVPNGDYVGTSREQSEDPFLIAMFVPDFGFNGKTADTAKVWPLGRGETLNYAGISEIDVLEVTADATRRLGTHPDRVTLQGDSMGGFGAYRLGTRYPDRWAALIPVIGGGAAHRNLFENMRNLPIYQINGFQDPLVSYSAALDDVARLDELGMEFVFYGLLDRGHDPSANSQCVRDNATEYVRNANPSEIVYIVDPATFQLDPERDLEIVYDSAYWISGLEVADETAEGSVRATSHALPRSRETLARNDVVRGNTTGAFDLCGPNPAFAPGWSPAFPNGESWREISLTRVPGAPEPLSATLDLELSNLAAVSVDLARAGFGSRGRGRLTVSTDSAVAVTLDRLRPGVPISIDDEPTGRTHPLRATEVHLPPGEHTIDFGS